VSYPASYSPLLLQAQITAPAGGEMGLADSTRLENPFQGPMWLDEIRFRLPDPLGFFYHGRSWSNIFCKLRLGNLPLTQGNVPISLLGKGLNDAAEASSLSIPGPPYVFTWKLPKPLFIPARDLLRPTIYYAPYAGAEPVTVTVCYACRPLPVGTPTPKVLQVPWVAAFVPPMQAAGVAAADRVDESQPSDLYNPWDQDLHVQRFVGRLMVQGDDGEEERHMGLASVTPDFQAGLSTNATGTLVSAQDSFNNILIRDPTPFAHVFDFVDRAWTVNALLPPKGFYQFTVERFWSQYPNQSITATPGISMVGWREVAYAP
jgi:hypothetical protein